MKLTLQVGAETFEVDVERTAKGIRVECEGVTTEYDVSVVHDGVEVGAQGKFHQLRFPSEDAVLVDGTKHRFRVLDFEPGSAVAAGTDGGVVSMRAAMPGRIVRILGEVGASVAKGDPLFVLEAMKMQNELASPYAGRVSELLVKPGDVVEAGRVLAKLETHARKG
jgi:biotin carboxyl carrier protein